MPLSSIASLVSIGSNIGGLFGGSPNVPTSGSQPWWVQSAGGKAGVLPDWITSLNNLFSQYSGISNTTNPAYQSSFNQEMGINYSPYLNAANQAGSQYGQLGGYASDIGSLLSNLSGQSNQMGTNAYNTGASIFPSLFGAGENANSALTGAAQGLISPLSSAGSNIMRTAFDPQNALYNRTLGQLTDQVNSQQALRGLGTSPEGGSEMNEALSNFNIDWQNQQLQRQIQGAGAAGNLAGEQSSILNSLYGGGASALASLTGAGAGAYGNLGGLGLQGSQLGGNQLLQALQSLSQAPGFTLQSGQVPVGAQQQVAGAPGAAANQYASGVGSSINPLMQLMPQLYQFLSGGGTGAPQPIPQWNPAGQAGAGLGTGLNQFSNSPWGSGLNTWLSNLFSGGGGGGGGGNAPY